MTTKQTDNPMSEAEARALAGKTLAWVDELTPKEQALLRQLLDAAHPLDDDVQGYGDVEYAIGSLLFYGDALPALQLAVNWYWQQQTPAVPAGPGGSTGGTLGSRTAMN
jgi:hypothetical protein